MDIKDDYRLFVDLEDRTAGTSLDAALADIRASGPFRNDSFLALAARAMDRKAHILRGWNRRKEPALFAQQFLLGAFELRLPRLVETSVRRLDALGKSYLNPLWRYGGASAALLPTLVGHRRSVFAVAVTADGQRVVSASDDNTLQGWDL